MAPPETQTRRSTGVPMTARPGELRRLSAGSVAEASLRDAEPSAFWLDCADRPQPRPPLTARTCADLIIVGGRVAGPVDGGARQGARSGPGRALGGGRPHRLGGLRAQRR